MTTPKTIEDVLEEHVKSLFPQITYVDRSHKAFKQALTTIETIMSERVIGEDRSPINNPTAIKIISAENNLLAKQRKNLKHVIYGEKE